nr:MAG TPA: hypothetical protein [Bacteriophage sp.]
MWVLWNGTVRSHELTEQSHLPLSHSIFMYWSG